MAVFIFFHFPIGDVFWHFRRFFPLQKSINIVFSCQTPVKSLLHVYFIITNHSKVFGGV